MCDQSAEQQRDAFTGRQEQAMGTLGCRCGPPYEAKSLPSGEEREYHVRVGVPNRKFWIKALRAVRQRASNLHPTLGSDLVFAAERAIAIVTSEHYRHTPESLHALRKELIKHSSEYCPSPDHPATFGMVQLYWFFRHECGLSGNESEVRASLVRNGFWPPLAKPIKVKLHYSDAESQGSTTVRQAVANFGRDRGKTS